MDTNQILPVLDTTLLQEKANEYAMKGATESIKEFYSGYNSPYRKAIDAQLNAHELGYKFQLPDIVAQINETLSREVDTIANEAISKTFLPLVSRFLTRAEKELKFSNILKEFIELFDLKDSEDCYVNLKRHTQYDWISVEISSGNKSYDLTLHIDWDSRKQPVKKYSFLGLPTTEKTGNQIMKIKIDDATLELPYTRDILLDNFVSYVATLVLSKTVITLDVEDFEDWMFPERCHCE